MSQKRNISILMKPASQRCNIDCKYCFYHDISQNREVEDYGKMKYETYRQVIKQAVDFANGGTISFGFQGGEPTLVGLKFYEQFINEVQALNTNNSKINYTLQTNGLLINDKWAQFFKEHNFLIGISLDGPQPIHDMNRIDYTKAGTHKQVMRAISYFKKHEVDFNILSVVTKASSTKGAKIANYFEKQNFKHIQYIPCLDGINDEPGVNEYSLSPQNYTQFLCDSFDHYYQQFKLGKPYSERYFDNILSIYLGGNPENCMQRGVCSIQFILEGDGSVYPCDFFVLEDYKIGSIHTDSFMQMLESDVAHNFIKSSMKIHDDCKQCRFLKVCRGGCKRYKQGYDANSKNIYCESFYNFLIYSEPKFQEMAAKIRSDLRNKWQQ